MSAPAVQPPLVLVADDDPLLRHLVETKLRSRGLRTVAAEDGNQAMASAEALQPDLIVLDHMMPGTDGYAVLAHLKSATHLATIPVVMLTARRGERDVVGALKLGAEDYVTKPFMPEELALRIERLLALRRAA